MKNKKPHYAWIILLGVILIRGFAGGGINSVSGLFLYPVSRDIGVGIGTLSIYLSITSIVMVLWLPLAGRLINRYDVRLVAAAGAVLQASFLLGFLVLAAAPPSAVRAAVMAFAGMFAFTARRRPAALSALAAAALAVLGYTQQDIAVAMKGVDVENLPLEEIVRQSLKKMVK